MKKTKNNKILLPFYYIIMTFQTRLYTYSIQELESPSMNMMRKENKF